MSKIEYFLINAERVTFLHAIAVRKTLFARIRNAIFGKRVEKEEKV